MKLIKKTNINFLQYKRIAIIISVILILAGQSSLILHSGPNLGIDFTGGTLIQIRFDYAMQTAELRGVLGNIGLENSIIQKTSIENEFIVRIPQMESERDINQEIKDLFAEKIPAVPYEIRRVEKVGPKIGEELRNKAVLAVLSAMLVIVIYITVRFEFKFALGALVALAHDVLFTLGFFSVLNLEISLPVIAAFLTIVGYSLNDTIVIFDRVRENLKIQRRETFQNVVNNSINESLSRTIITSLTTFVVVFILFVAGGEVIHAFSAAMLIGVVVGTYSSIYIASPVVIAWQSRFGSRKKK